MKELASAMAKAQSEVKAALKDSKNPHFKSSYADLTSVWDACRSALTKNGLSVVQRTDFDASDMWLETMLLHASGESITGRYPLRPQQQTPQGFGSALTYARRYALAAMVGVVADEDDDGSAASVGRPSNGASYDPPPPQQTMAGRKNEADGIKKAREWANNAHATLAGFDTALGLKTWIEKNSATVEKLKAVVPDEFEALDARINATAERLNVLNAG